MKNIFNSIDIRFLIVTVISFGLSYCTMNGITQQYIHFNNMDNEMAFTAFTAMVGFIGLSGIKK
tara:strand:+ start:278 stop:469 length:192 start_codon:yes stop_codon:yes gene_type:complete